jgi:PAS domain S-box-containing protein
MAFHNMIREKFTVNAAVALLFLIIEAFLLYLLVLGSHAMRHRYGMSHFYAIIGAITAVMSWVTEIGINVEYYGVTFFIGSTVFYTSLLLGVFIVYMFDGPHATRVVISTIIGVSILVPVVLAVLNFQMDLSDIATSEAVPSPALRINAASIVSTFLDLMFLAMVWEYLGNRKFRMQLWLRTYVTLLGVMVLDVILFNTGAFLGSDDYLTIMKGTFSSRFIVSIISFPLLWSYITWQSTQSGVAIETRPVLSIIQQKADVEHELSMAQNEIRERKRVEDALRKSEERYRSLFDNMFEGAYQTTPDGKILSANSALQHMLGYDTLEELLREGNARDIHADPTTRNEMVRKLHDTGELRSEELSLRTRDGRSIIVLENSLAIRDDQGNVIRFEGTLTDITERKFAEKRIRESLEEKEILLKEVHHRVKNNMQIISSLLDLQAGTSDDPRLEEMLSMSQRRIRAMGLIHEQLYTSENFGTIHAPDYIGNLAQYMSQITSTSSLLPDIRVDVEDLTLTIDTAIPVGLIITEIITNAIKYAFPAEWFQDPAHTGSDGSEAVLVISLQSGEMEGHYILEVSDNGVGLPESMEFESSGSLGLQLVTMLTQQLKGTIEVDRSAGTRFRITFASRNSSTLQEP